MTFENKHTDVTSVPTHVFRDPRLSDKAKGRMGHIMSFPAGQKLTVQDMISETKGGRSAIYSALNELIDLGYLERTVTRGGDGRVQEGGYRIGPAVFDPNYAVGGDA